MADRKFEGLKILLVEEEVLIAMDIEQLCYEQGATAVETIGTEDMLASAARDPEKAKVIDVDAAILDVKVGESLTSDLAARLRDRNIPFIFATGYTTAEPFFTQFPDVPMIAKPYVGPELVEALATAVSRARSRND